MHNPPPKKTILPIAVILLLLIAGSVIYFRYNPAGSPLFPKCPFLMMTGLKCPGCGSQRAIHALLHLDFRSACSHNAMLVISLPYVILLLAARGIRIFAPRPALSSRLQRPQVIWSYFALLILFWITRNVFDF
jgi:hypothetical protein